MTRKPPWFSAFHDFGLGILWGFTFHPTILPPPGSVLHGRSHPSGREPWPSEFGPEAHDIWEKNHPFTIYFGVGYQGFDP